MNNGNGITMRPSVMNYRKLQSRKSWLGLKNADIAKAAGACVVTVSRFLNGDDAVKPEIQDAIARALRMRRTIDFQPLEIDRDFAQSVSGSGVKHSIRWEPARSVWLVIQEATLVERAIGEFYGIEAEKLARFVAEQFNAAMGGK